MPLLDVGGKAEADWVCAATVGGKAEADRVCAGSRRPEKLIRAIDGIAVCMLGGCGSCEIQCCLFREKKKPSVKRDGGTTCREGETGTPSLVKLFLLGGVELGQLLSLALVHLLPRRRVRGYACSQATMQPVARREGTCE